MAGLSQHHPPMEKKITLNTLAKLTQTLPRTRSSAHHSSRYPRQGLEQKSRTVRHLSQSMVHSSYKIYSNGTDGITLTEGNIADMEDSYNFLGILQTNGNQVQGKVPMLSTC